MFLDHYSYSSYRMFKECPKLFELVKTGQMERRKTGAMSFGSYYHTQVENYHKGRLYDETTLKEYAEVFPKDFFKPENVEVRFRGCLAILPSGKFIKTPFVGIVDGINEQGLHDLKTWSYSKSQEELDKDEQATLYLFMNYLKTGEIVPFNFNIFLKLENRIERIQTTRVLSDFGTLFLKLQKFDKLVREDRFPCTCGKHIKDTTFPDIEDFN